MNYGISELSIIPMRSKCSDKSEMTNHILFGEHFKVLERKEKWSRIRLSHDNYEGWICNKQWREVSEEYFNALDKEISSINIDLVTTVSVFDYGVCKKRIVIGSILPFYKSYK